MTKEQEEKHPKVKLQNKTNIHWFELDGIERHTSRIQEPYKISPERERELYKIYGFDNNNSKKKIVSAEEPEITEQQTDKKAKWVLNNGGLA